MVDKSASADRRATKMLIDMMKDVEHSAGDAVPPPEPRRLAAADKDVMQLFVARLRRQILQEIAEAMPDPPPGEKHILILGLHFRSWPAHGSALRAARGQALAPAIHAFERGKQVVVCTSPKG